VPETQSPEIEIFEVLPPSWTKGVPAYAERLICQFFSNVEVIRQILGELTSANQYVFVPVTDWTKLLGTNEFPYLLLSELLTDRNWVESTLYTSLVIAGDGIYNEKWAQMLLVSQAYFQASQKYLIRKIALDGMKIRG
jgi:hypothetical protein